jgi:hypothetical protein
VSGGKMSSFLFKKTGQFVKNPNARVSGGKMSSLSIQKEDSLLKSLRRSVWFKNFRRFIKKTGQFVKKSLSNSVCWKNVVVKSPQLERQSHFWHRTLLAPPPCWAVPVVAAAAAAEGGQKWTLPLEQRAPCSRIRYQGFRN